MKKKQKRLNLWGVFQTDGYLFIGYDHYEDAQWCVQMFTTKKLARECMIRQGLDSFCEVRRVSVSWEMSDGAN